MACEHDLAEMDTAAHFDGLCPLCLLAENERLRALIVPAGHIKMPASREEAEAMLLIAEKYLTANA